MRWTDGEKASLSGMQSVNRALDVLFLLAQTGEPHAASQIAHELGLSRPTVYRILDTLSGKGVVIKVDNGFGVTDKLARIAAGPTGAGLADAVNPYLHTLVALTHETAGFHVRVGDMRRCTIEVEGHHGIRWARGVGFTAPVWSGAVGHVILADLADDEISEILRRADFNLLARNTARGPSEVFDRVHAARERGWSLSESETVSGAAAVAAPIRNDRGRTAGVLSLYAPADRFEAIKEYVSDLVRIAARASKDWIGTEPSATVIH